MRRFDRRTTSDQELRLRAALREPASRHLEPTSAELAAWEAEVPPFPLKVQIQTSTRCNARCAMCPHPEITGEAGFRHATMTDELLGALLAELAEHPVERLSLFLMNEPLLDPDLAARIARARRALPETTLGLFSNGALLRPQLAQALADAGLDELCVSVHGFEPNVYARVMGGLRFEVVDRNLRELFARAEGGRLGRMRVQVVSGDVPEVRATLPLAHESYRDHVLLKAFSNEREASGVRPDLHGSAHFDPSCSGSSGTGCASRAICQRPFVKLYVTTDGDCVLCNVDWRRSTVLGRFQPGGPSLKSIWNGAAYREVRRQHLLGRFPGSSPCERCDYAAVADLDGIGTRA